jgi:HAD superfamily hydrolase (TIGR01509 family)
MPPITTLLFDLDGLLTDTETLHYESYRQVFAARGYTMSEEFYCEHWIRRGLKIDDVCAHLSISEEPSSLRDAKMSIYFQLVKNELRLMPGAQKALEGLRSRYTLALVTSAYTDAANAVLDAMKGYKYFDTIVTASDVTRLKPDPEPWLLAASRLGRAPADCLVIEDAEKGITAAKAAGMRCVAIPGKHTRDNDFSAATIVLKSLDELTFELIASL